MHESEKQQMTEALAILARPTAANEMDLRKTLAQFSSKVLRTVCYHLQLRVVKSGPERNDFKNGYLVLLDSHYKAKTQVDASIGNVSKRTAPLQKAASTLGQASALYTNWRRKTKACGLRLVNVICYELNVARVCDFMSQCENEVRLTDDQPKVLAFWENIAKEFSIPRSTYGQVRFEHASFQDIDPSKILQHDARKLQGMWKEMTSKYAQNMKRFSEKGSTPSHEDFLRACSRHLDVFYLFMWFQERPALEQVILGTCRTPVSPAEEQSPIQTPIVNDRQVENTEYPLRPVKRIADNVPLRHCELRTAIRPPFPRALPNKIVPAGNIVSDRENALDLPYPHGNDEEREVPHITVVPIEWEIKNRDENLTNTVPRRLSRIDNDLTILKDASSPTDARSKLLSLQVRHESSRRLEEQYERAVRMVGRLLAARADAEKQTCNRELLMEIQDDLAYTLAWKRQCRREMSAQRF